MNTRIIKIITTILVSVSLLLVLPKDSGSADSHFIAEFQPEETDDILQNPYTGWAPWASGGPYQVPHSLVYINASWQDLEPEKGNYRFDLLELENKFEYWKSKNVRIIIRIHMDYPGTARHMDIPDWLYNETDRDGTWYDVPYGKGYSPNYSNKVLIRYHELLIKALAGRYNSNDQIAFIAIGSLGHWGEFHTYKGRNYYIPFPGTQISDQYVLHYIDNFTEKPLMIRRPFNIAKANGLGLFNDSFGDERQTVSYFLDFINKGYDDYLTGEQHPAMPDYWKSAPVGGEFADYPGTEYLKDNRIDRTIEMAKASHLSWLGPSAPVYRDPGSEISRNSRLLLKTMGYRLMPLHIKIKARNFSTNNIISIETTWTNKGAAPFYFDWPMEISIVDAQGRIAARKELSVDLKSWLPEKIIKLPEVSFFIPKPADGSYHVQVGFINPSSGRPEIKLPIAERISEGVYKLASIEIFEGELYK